MTKYRPGEPLSPDARARREQGLDQLRGVVRSRGRRRIATSIGAGAATLGLLAGIAYWGLAKPPKTEARGSGEVVAQQAPPAPIITPTASTIELVKTDPGIVAAMSVHRGPAVERLTDGELQAVLREAGKPSGLVRLGSKVYLSTDLAADTGDSPDSATNTPLP